MQTKYIFVIKTHLLRTLRVLLAKLHPRREVLEDPGCAQGRETRGQGHAYLRVHRGWACPTQMSPVLEEAAVQKGLWGPAGLSIGSGQNNQWPQGQILSCVSHLESRPERGNSALSPCFGEPTHSGLPTASLHNRFTKIPVLF